MKAFKKPEITFARRFVDYLTAERWADEYAGDTGQTAWLYERFSEDTEALDLDARGELWVANLDPSHDCRNEVQYIAGER